MLQLMSSSLQSLQNGELLICPIDYHYAILARVDQSNIDRIEDIKSRFDIADPLTILTASLEDLKQFAPRIHPRVDTLISIHEKALALRHPEYAINTKKLGTKYHIRLVREESLLTVLRHLGESLISLPLGDTEDYEQKAQGLKSYVDCVIDGMAESFLSPSPVYASYGAKGQLEFEGDSD